MTWTTHEEQIHGTAIPIVMVLGGIIALGLVSTVSKFQARQNDHVDAGSVPGMLSGLSILAFVFSIFLLFTSNWNMGANFMFFAVAGFGAAASKAFSAAIVSGVFATLGFLQNSGVFFIVTGGYFIGLHDGFNKAVCREYFQEQDGTIDRCKDDEYLQLARSSALLLLIFQFTIAFLSFQLAGTISKSTKA